MSIQFSTPPPEASQAVVSKLRSVREQPVTNVRGLGGVVSGQATPTMPHEVYVLGLRDVLSGRLPDNFRPSGWRYILQAGGSAVSSAETQATGGATQQFSEFNSGPYVAATVQTLDRMASLPQIRGKNLTARLLRIPALHLTALWLHGEDEDVFVPLEPAPSGVEANRQYQASELFAALRREAETLVHIGPADLTGGS